MWVLVPQSLLLRPGPGRGGGRKGRAEAPRSAPLETRETAPPRPPASSSPRSCQRLRHRRHATLRAASRPSFFSGKEPSCLRSWQSSSRCEAVRLPEAKDKVPRTAPAAGRHWALGGGRPSLLSSRTIPSPRLPASPGCRVLESQFKAQCKLLSSQRETKQPNKTKPLARASWKHWL